jgi:hypothetical protein
MTAALCSRNMQLLWIFSAYPVALIGKLLATIRKSILIPVSDQSMSYYTAFKTNHHKDTRQTAPPKRRYRFTNLHGVISRKTFTLYQHSCDKHKARNIKQLLRCAAAFICLKGQRFGLKTQSNVVGFLQTKRNRVCCLMKVKSASQLVILFFHAVHIF